jgi:signal recognition particle receptor subunit beta
MKRPICKIILISTGLISSNFELHSAQPPAGYTLVKTDPEVAGRHEYKNFTVRREATVNTYWQNVANPGKPFNKTDLTLKDDTIFGHEGRRIVHVIPLRTENGPIPRDKRLRYEDLYKHLSDVDNAQKIFVAPLFYRPEGRDHIYSVKVTQQHWERVDQTRVDFLIVSYNSEEKLKFVDVASTTGGLILNSHLPAPGLYSLIAANNDIDSAQAPAAGQLAQWTGRKEKWKHLESDDLTEESTIEIRIPHGVLSIPGNGMFALRDKEEATDGDVAQLKREMESAKNYIDRLTVSGNVDGTVLVTGPTGCGKTTFINCYANNPCVSRAKKDGTGWELYFPRSQANLAVGYGKGSQTDKPALHFDTKSNIVLCDTPGDNDTRGYLKQIVNAYMVHRMFNNTSDVKLLLVIDESKILTEHAKGFIEALDDVVNSCTDDAALYRMICLMVSKHRETETQTILKNLLGNPSAEPEEPQHELLNDKPRLVNFIRFLATHPDRLCVFPASPIGKAGHEIPFYPELSEIRNSISSAGFVPNPQMKIKLNNDCNVRIETFARRLNEDMVKYLRKEGAQRILRYCLRLINEHNSAVSDLRARLSEVVTRLRNINITSTATPEEFVTVFDGSPKRVNVAAIPQIFDAHEMKEIIDNLKFLKTILPEKVSYNISEWKDALSGATDFTNTIGKIDKLAEKPLVTFDNGTLLAKGIVVGSTDIESFISDRSISPASIVIQALHTWFIDQNMDHQNLTGNRTSIFAIAPRWKVTSGDKIINLSGGDGSNGTAGAAGAIDAIGNNGAPGESGRTAGSFFGKVYNPVNVSSLTIHANGGKGGNGGDGGRGGNGLDAGDGEESSMAVLPGRDSGNVTIIKRQGKLGEDTGLYCDHRAYGDLKIRDEKLGYLEHWIGRDNFHHEIWIDGTVQEKQHAPLGNPGKNGGQGGLKGLGGNAGDIEIQGPDLVLKQKENKPGASGAKDGGAGAGGKGGANGQVLTGTLWTACVLHGLATHPAPSLSDRWHVKPSHKAPATAKAKSGESPSPAVSSVAPTAPDPKVVIDQAVQDAKVDDFRTYYFKEAHDPLVSSFIGIFPGLAQ